MYLQKLFLKKNKRTSRGDKMSSFVQDWKCSKCKSDNACYEDFKDSEEGYIFECKDCKYMEVYREDVDTGKVIENYAGYEHYYNQQASEQKG